MILLDTHTVLWLHAGSRRARPLERRAGALHISPVTVLELHFLVEAGRLRLRPGAAVGELVDDDRWAIDDPPAAAWFERAAGESWTRDPFDRLIVAHARLRGWRLATADSLLLERLSPGELIEL